MALNAPYTPNTVIQSTQVSNDLTGLASGINDTTNNSMATYRNESNFDYVASGCVWSGDAYNSTRNGSQTSGVIYQAGVRLPVASVSAHLFTASKDTYVDINTSGAQVYTEATNNAASPALTSGFTRIAIIITGATAIVNSGSVNQGQEFMVLPIASSINYSVTDSLGNLICSRDINRKLLTYAQNLAAVTFNSGTPIVLGSLSKPLIVPSGGRKIKITVYTGQLFNSAATTTTIGIYSGASSGALTTLLQSSTLNTGGLNVDTTIPMTIFEFLTPAAGLIWFSAAGSVGAGTGTFFASSASAAFISTELE